MEREKRRDKQRGGGRRGEINKQVEREKRSDKQTGGEGEEER